MEKDKTKDNIREKRGGGRRGSSFGRPKPEFDQKIFVE